MDMKRKTPALKNAEREHEATRYAKTVVAMRKQALLGNADAHAWLGKEQLPRKQRPPYALKANSVQALSHIRIAARKGHGSARRWLETRRDPHPLSRKVAEHGEMRHSATDNTYAVTRSAWFDGATLPEHEGVYERKLYNQVVYALWIHGMWTDNRDDPENLADEYIVGTLSKARGKRLAWRGLANDPSPPRISDVDSTRKFKVGFSIGGYVEHKEPMSPVVKMVHMAKTIKSKDGNFLTVCGHRARPGETLRLWSSGVEIKVVGGQQPELCPACEKIACEGHAPTDQNDCTTIAENGSDVGTHPLPTEDGMNQPESKQTPRPAPVDVKEAYTNAAGHVKPAFSPVKQPSYVGGIGYENYHTGSRVERFEFIDRENIRLELRSKVDDPDTSDSWFRGLATKSWDGSFSTEWVTLETANGEAHPYGQSRLSFSILHHDSMMIKIEGAWADRGYEKQYTFVSILHRQIVDPIQTPIPVA